MNTQNNFDNFDKIIKKIISNEKLEDILIKILLNSGRLKLLTDAEYNKYFNAAKSFPNNSQIDLGERFLRSFFDHSEKNLLEIILLLYVYAICYEFMTSKKIINEFLTKKHVNNNDVNKFKNFTKELLNENVCIYKHSTSNSYYIDIFDENKIIQQGTKSIIGTVMEIESVKNLSNLKNKIVEFKSKKLDIVKQCPVCGKKINALNKKYPKCEACYDLICTIAKEYNIEPKYITRDVKSKKLSTEKKECLKKYIEKIESLNVNNCKQDKSADKSDLSNMLENIFR